MKPSTLLTGSVLIMAASLALTACGQKHESAKVDQGPKVDAPTTVDPNAPAPGTMAAEAIGDAPAEETPMTPPDKKQQ